MRNLALILLLFSHVSLTGYAQPHMVDETMPGIPAHLVEFKGELYFENFENSLNSNWHLWKSDGTAAGTQLVKQFTTASSGTRLHVWNELLVFARTHELWKSDGTTAGTELLMAFPDDIFLEDFTPAGDKFYFRTTSVDGPNELWKSNGTVGGTVKVADINRLITPGSPNDLPEFTYANGLLFFFSSTPNQGAELWKSDGTAAGTKMVKDILPGYLDGIAYDDSSRMTAYGNQVYFAATEGLNGNELWTSDGSAGGTRLVKDIEPGPASSNPYFLQVAGSFLYFNATTAATGEELWKTIGTSAGTVLVKDINPGANGSGPSILTNVNGTLYFNAQDGGPTGLEAWKSNGTTAGTVVIADLVPGLPGSDPIDFTGVNGVNFMSATTPVTGREVWVTDITGTHVLDIRPGERGSLPQFLTVVGTKLFFQADDGIHGRKLWVYETAFQGISGFTLLNAAQDNELGALNENRVIDLTNPTNQLNVRAEVITGATIGSIVFELNGVRFRVENGVPFTLAGENGPNDYLPWIPAPGDYDLCATPWSGRNGTGTRGETVCVHFRAIDFGILSYTLVNADTDEDIITFTAKESFEPEDVVELDLSGLLHPERINLRVNTVPAVVDEVSFGFNGDDYGHVELTAPYALFGDNNGDYKAWWDVHKRRMGGGCGGVHYCAVSVRDGNNSEGTFFQFRLKYEDIRVESFTLVNALNNTDIQQLNEGDVIDLSALPTNKLNIRVNTIPPVVPGMRIGAGIDLATAGPVNFIGGSQVSADRVLVRRHENTAPYALFGDGNGNYNDQQFVPGNYSLSATPYSVAQNGDVFSDPQGVCGLSKGVSFTVFQSSASKMSAEIDADAAGLFAFRLYPNPNDGKFNVLFSFEESAHVKVEVLDLVGKVVFTDEMNSFSGLYQKQIDLGEYAQGVYLLRVQQEEKSYLRKVLIGR